MDIVLRKRFKPRSLTEKVCKFSFTSQFLFIIIIFISSIGNRETAEFPNLYASIFSYSLPKTGINVDVPKGKIHRINGIDNEKGVIPDIFIKDHLLDEKDEILEGLLRKLNVD